MLEIFNFLIRIEFVEKNCGENGHWESRRSSAAEEDSPNGWTNYTPCFTQETLSLFQKIYTGSEEDAKVR